MNSLAIDKTPGDTRVVVAMSGGVDSSVTAALLADQGYDVMGITLQLYDHGEAMGRPGSCCAGQDIRDARRVAEKLDIPHYVLDYETRFRETVIERFAESYIAGETPIPCVLCNQHVKFTDLLQTAEQLGADALATGHYVRRYPTDAGAALFRGLDVSRDQSYFLFSTTPHQLKRLRFPLGELDKDETRALARRFHLATAEKADSQDICFVPKGGYSDVVKRLRPEAHRPGEIVDKDGRVLGQHDGIAHFTVGQRRHLGISADHPLYVISIDPENNHVVVGPREALECTSLIARDLNWLGDHPINDAGDHVQVKLRSAMPCVDATVFPLADNQVKVVLPRPVAGVSPGQACVMYDGNRLLGGGWITRNQAPSTPYTNEH